MRVQRGVFGDDKPVYGQDPDASPAAPDSTEPPNEEWPVQLYYNEDKLNFKKTRTELLPGQNILQPDTLYIGDRYVSFRADDRVVMVPLQLTTLMFYAPDGRPRGMES